MAEALGRLCQAASSNKRSRAASPSGSAGSHSSSRRHAHHASGSTSRVQAQSAEPSDTSGGGRTAQSNGHSTQALSDCHSRQSGADDGDDRGSSSGTAGTATPGLQAGSSTTACGPSSQAHPAADGIHGNGSGGESISEQADTSRGGDGSKAGSQQHATAGSTGHRLPGHDSPGVDVGAADTAGGTAGMLAALHSLDAQAHAAQASDWDAAYTSYTSSTTAVTSQPASDSHHHPLLDQQERQGLRSHESDLGDTTAGQDKATAVAGVGSATAAVAEKSAIESPSPSRSNGRSSGSSQAGSPTADLPADSPVASLSGSPVTPAPMLSFRSAMGRLRGVDAAELQSPNRRKYGRSESKDPGTKISDHSVGKCHWVSFKSMQVCMPACIAVVCKQHF